MKSDKHSTKSRPTFSALIEVVNGPTHNMQTGGGMRGTLGVQSLMHAVIPLSRGGGGGVCIISLQEILMYRFNCRLISVTSM